MNRKYQNCQRVPEMNRKYQVLSTPEITTKYQNTRKYQPVADITGNCQKLPKKVPEISRKSKILNYQKVRRGVRPPLAPPKISLLSLSFTQSISLNNLGRT